MELDGWHLTEMHTVEGILRDRFPAKAYLERPVDMQSRGLERSAAQSKRVLAQPGVQRPDRPAPLLPGDGTPWHREAGLSAGVYPVRPRRRHTHGRLFPRACFTRQGLLPLDESPTGYLRGFFDAAREQGTTGGRTASRVAGQLDLKICPNQIEGAFVAILAAPGIDPKHRSLRQRLQKDKSVSRQDLLIALIVTDRAHCCLARFRVDFLHLRHGAYRVAYIDAAQEAQCLREVDGGGVRGPCRWRPR